MGFEQVAAGLGTEWDFNENGPLDGTFMETGTKSVPDSNGPVGSMREATYFQFSNVDGQDSNEVFFVWGSYSLDQAFAAERDGAPVIQFGDRVLINYLGKREIKDGKQTMRSYRVDRWNAEPDSKKK